MTQFIIGYVISPIGIFNGVDDESKKNWSILSKISMSKCYSKLPPCIFSKIKTFNNFKPYYVISTNVDCVCTTMPIDVIITHTSSSPAHQIPNNKILSTHLSILIRNLRISISPLCKWFLIIVWSKEEFIKEQVY